MFQLNFLVLTQINDANKKLKIHFNVHFIQFLGVGEIGVYWQQGLRLVKDKRKTKRLKLALPEIKAPIGHFLISFLAVGVTATGTIY